MGKGMIGASYKYWNCPDILVLKSIDGFIYRFECGHWCTDTVFVDLYQITLF